ncbi:MAG: hypothetical protein ACLFV2_09255 [Desulfurivibrionaceae bacterium]
MIKKRADPVIRYITDAIASERRQGDKIFKQPYVIEHTKPSRHSDNERTWHAMGIQPVLYSYSHNYLYNTLKKWNNYVRDGLNAKARIVREEALKTPLPPFDQDESVSRLTDVLSEKTRYDHEDITGYPAKIFSELINPPAPVEWLQVLHEKGLLSIASQKESVMPVTPFQYEVHLFRPNIISDHLWNWLLKHLENDNLIIWVIDQGGCLHPILKDKIKRRIREKPPNDPYLLFWKITTSDYVSCGRKLEVENYEKIKSLKTDVDQLSLTMLADLLEPSFAISKSIDFLDPFRESYSLKDREKSPPFRIDIVISLTEWAYDKLKKLDTYPDKFTDLLLPATHALLKALQFWEFAGLGDKKSDPGQGEMPSILPHSQNEPYRIWGILLEICRDLWETTWENDREKAYSILDIWRSLQYPTFRRLILYAMTVKDVADPEKIIDYVLEDNGWWLWAIPTQREIFRILAKVWPELNDTNADLLIKSILQGPPRVMFRADLTEEEWKRRVDRDIWLMLAKLESFGKPLPANAKEVLQRLSSKHPEWRLQEDERDEFTYWIGKVRAGPEVDISVPELFKKDIPSIIDLLSQTGSIYYEGRLDAFRVGSKEHRRKTIEALRYLLLNGDWNKDIWHAGLIGLTNCNENTWNEVAPLLTGADSELYGKASWPIAHWTKNSIGSIQCGSPEEYHFWTIFKALLDNCIDYKEPNQIEDAVTYALNNPVGIMTQALMDRFGACNLEAGQGLPKGSLRESLDILLNDKPATLPGKIILASRLPYFHAVDPIWTEKNLIPLFDWDKSKNPVLFWEGYMWNPRISADLAIALKGHLQKAIKNTDQLEERATENLVNILAVVFLYYPELYKTKEQQDMLINAGTKGLEHITGLFWRSISRSEDSQDADNYWKNRVKPLIKRAWPKSPEFITGKTSKNFSLMLIELDETFPKAFEFLKPFLKPFPDLWFLVNQLDQKNLPQKQPQMVFQLLSKTFSKKLCQWPDNEFRNVLDKIVKKDPSINRDDPSYREMDDFLIQHNL